MKGKRHQEKVVDKNTRCLCIVEIRSIPTPDAESRLSRSIDILLVSAAKELEASIDAKIEEPSQNSPLTEAMERKDESQSSGKKTRET